MVTHRKHRVPAARVVLAIHPRECEEVRNLPHKQQAAQQPRARVDVARNSRPTDHRRNRSAHRANQRVEGRARLEWRVENSVEQDVERRECRGQKPDHDSEQPGTRVASHECGSQNNSGVHLFGWQRSASRPQHQCVATAFKELVEEGCACSSQRRSRAGPGQSHPIDGTEFGEGKANRGGSEDHRVEPHLRELSPDAQHALCARCNGSTRIGGDRVIRCNLVFCGLGHERGGRALL